ncbi:unnamed protein product, partial [Sphenostylis stenocarpa]
GEEKQAFERQTYGCGGGGEEWRKSRMRIMIDDQRLSLGMVQEFIEGNSDMNNGMLRDIVNCRSRDKIGIGNPSAECIAEVEAAAVETRRPLDLPLTRGEPGLSFSLFLQNTCLVA